MLSLRTTIRRAWLCRRLSVETPDDDLFGLFETPKGDTDTRDWRKKRYDLSMKGTLDAEVVRVGKHVDIPEKSYIPSHDLDQKAKDLWPETSSVGFPHLRQTLTEAQTSKLSEIIHLSEHQEAAPSIFHWEVHYVMTKGDYEHHKNRYVKMRVFMKELQRRYDLSDDAVQHVIRIVDSRYDPDTGLMTLSSRKYPKREDNRREVMRIVIALIDEGKKRFPNTIRRPRSFIERRYGRRDPEIRAVENAETASDIDDLFAAIDKDNDGYITLNDWKQFYSEFQYVCEDDFI